MIQATYSVGESVKSTDDCDLIIVLAFTILEGGSFYGC